MDTIIKFLLIAILIISVWICLGNKESFSDVGTKPVSGTNNGDISGNSNNVDISGDSTTATAISTTMSTKMKSDLNFIEFPSNVNVDGVVRANGIGVLGNLEVRDIVRGDRLYINNDITIKDGRLCFDDMCITKKDFVSLFDKVRFFESSFTKLDPILKGLDSFVRNLNSGPKSKS